MNSNVFGADEQADISVELERWVNLAQAVLADVRPLDDGHVSLIFVDEMTISSLNEEFMGKKGPTDVLSFPIDDDFPAPGRTPDRGGTGPTFIENDEVMRLIGDVVICPLVAQNNAVTHEVTIDDEIALLVVHGLLHLFGMDHVTDNEAEVMEAKERQLLAKHYAEAKTKPS